VTDACNTAGEEFGDERLTAWLADRAPASASALLEALLAEVRAFCAGADQRDDITITVTRFVPPRI
jgi:sigma-B regulation protein RsbU (phosphoserine phosphatase)